MKKSERIPLNTSKDILSLLIQRYNFSLKRIYFDVIFFLLWDESGHMWTIIVKTWARGDSVEKPSENRLNAIRRRGLGGMRLNFQTNPKESSMVVELFYLKFLIGSIICSGRICMEYFLHPATAASLV